MLSLIITCLLFVSKLNQAPVSVEYKVITVVEVIRDDGWGKSLIVSQNGKMIKEEIIKNPPEYYDFKSTKTGKYRLKADSIDLTPLSTIRSDGGLNFNNIATNDIIITNKINELTTNGWLLTFIAPGVISSEQGFILTRYYFKKEY
ncbi:MAG TPA: hypothetical protein VFG10_11495 [Saprospiraceae bacterium]|nr:hypothetical protein [Saprospiraceae bacterium]